MNRSRMLALAVLAGACALAVFGGAQAAPEDVEVGAVRAVLARDGAALRENPSALGRPLSTLRHGVRVRIDEVRGRWARVTAVAAPGTAAASGWLRTSQTVEPFALTGGGQRGPLTGGTGGRASQDDISAAGRQFDPRTESKYRAANPNLERFYPLVDRIEASGPSAAEVESFIRDGRLGRPGRGR